MVLKHFLSDDVREVVQVNSVFQIFVRETLELLLMGENLLLLKFLGHEFLTMINHRWLLQ